MNARIAERLSMAATVEKTRWHAYYIEKQLELEGGTDAKAVQDAFNLWRKADKELSDARADALDEALKIPY